MNTEIKVRLVVYKLFDKVVIQQLEDMYDGINSDLISAGVLPRIKSTVNNSDSNSSEAATPKLNSRNNSSPESDAHAGVQTTTTDVADNVFSSLQQLLSKQREGLESGLTIDSPTSAENSTNTFSYTPQDIVSALSQLQAGAELALLKNQDQESANIIKTTVMKEIGKIKGRTQGKQIAQADIDSIDIVSRLFDFILDDPALSDCLKVQIVRLQIPVLKVAILDNDFFSMKSHPARQLLNELAYAGSGLDEADPEEDATLNMVDYVVGRILTEFDDNTKIFETLLSEFTSFMEDEKESNKLTEDMLEGAKNTAVKEIQLKVENHNVPALVNTILLDAWKDVLIHLYLRDGIKSNAWGTALQVIDDLIWSVEPKLIVSERNRLIKVIPGILNGLRDGFTLINFNMKRSEELFDQLEELHLASLRGGIPVPEIEQTKQTNTLIHYEESDSLTEDDFGIDLSNFTEDSTPVNDQFDPYTAEIITPSEENNDVLFSLHAESISEMALGTWVEFVNPDTETRSRGKLAWKCDFTKEFTFVDRKYKVVADLTYRQLIEKFESEHAAIVEDIPLFDRALDSVIVGIKQALDIKNSTEH